jgi:PAS domain S-box-containing protein
VSAAASPRRFAGPLASAAVVALLGLMEAGVIPARLAQPLSDRLQLAIALFAAAACLWAARGRTARAFWASLALGCVAWAAGQLVWVVRGVPFGLDAGYPEADLAFWSSTPSFVAAFVLRPDRRDRQPSLLLIDVMVTGVTLLYLYFEIAYVYLVLGDLSAYEVWSTFVYDFRGLALLPAVLWAVYHSEPRRRPLYVRLAAAFLLLQFGGSFTNQSFASGSGAYHAGFYDLPWTLPFVWIGLLALRAAPLESAPAKPHPPSWSDIARATVVAFVAVLLFPVVQVVLAFGSDPQSMVSHLRTTAALAGTLLVAGLFLVRQLVVLRQAERALREGEERFRALLDNSEEGVGVYGADLTVQYVSGVAEPLWGTTPEERVGRSALDFVHPEDREKAHALVAAALHAPGERVSGSLRLVTQAGAVRELEIEAVNRLAEPAVQGIVANFRDVTERRRAEEERARSASLLEATLESTTDGILVAGLDGRARRFNQKFSAMWRVPRELLEQSEERAIASVLDQLVEPQAFIDRVRDLYGRVEAESLDTLHFHDGRVFERYSMPQRLGGEVVGRVWSFRDVSERAHARQATDRLVAIIEATPDLVGIADAAGRPLFLNRAGRRMLGLADAAPLDEDILRYYLPQESARIAREALPTAIREGSWSGESAIRHRENGEVPVLQVIVSHRDEAGEVEFLSTIARDIRERKLAEEELRRAQTMAALGSLVAGVAHEVRNPLFGMGSTLDAFEARFGDRSDHRPYLVVFREQLERLSGLMNDLLEYAKPAGLRLAHGPIGPVVKEAVDACRELARRGGVRLETRLAPGLPALRMDPKRLMQAFRNLLENSVQHSPTGAEVRIGAELVRRGGEARLECVVEDRGPGFKPDDLPHVFEPFFTRRHGGTGLGLSIVYRVVSDHGGTIDARNRPGGGACITVGLPLAGGR